MARFFSRKGSHEADEKSQAPVQAVVAGEYSSEEGVVEHEHDDLHRGMKPRQLSACCLYLATLLDDRATDSAESQT
jgi:hypothetical protein